MWKGNIWLACNAHVKVISSCLLPACSQPCWHDFCQIWPNYPQHRSDCQHTQPGMCALMCGLARHTAWVWTDSKLTPTMKENNNNNKKNTPKRRKSWFCLGFELPRRWTSLAPSRLSVQRSISVVWCVHVRVSLCKTTNAAKTSKHIPQTRKK